MSRKYESPGSDDRHIWDLFLSGVNQSAVVAADDLGVFTALEESPATKEELSQRMGFDERATGVLLRLLAGLELVIPREGRFQLTDRTRTYLLKSSPFYWGHMMRVAVSQWHLETMTARLKHRPGRAPGPVPDATGEGRSIDGWAAGQISADEAQAIAARMHSHSLPAAIGAARSYDFSEVQRVLDVGGGSGCFTIAMAQVCPHLRGTIMELPAMCRVAQGYIREGGVDDLVDAVPVDMFREDWPRGYDAVFFSNVWHDWSVQTCRWLAERSFEILPSGGRILLHEMLLDDDGAGPATAAAFSMLMLLATQGQQFTFGEIKAILEGAGFSRVETRQTYAYYSITTGYK